MQGLQWPSPSTSTATTTTIPTTLTHTPPPPPPPPPPSPAASIDFLHAQTDNLHHSIDSLSVSQNSFQSSLSSQMASFQHTILELLQCYHNPLPPTHNISFGPLNGATSQWTGLGLSNPPSSPHTYFSSPGSNVSEVWFAPDDPSLPPPWKGVVDGTTRCLYYWNMETNITQYEKPAYWVPSPSPSPSCFPDPFYPPPSTTSDYNHHSQHPNLYPHYQAPAETIINGYTFPTQFPFPNYTHTLTNQPIYPQSQSMVEPIYPPFPSFHPASNVNSLVPTFQTPSDLNPSIPTFVPQLQFSDLNPSPSFLSMGNNEPQPISLGLNAAPILATQSSPTQSPNPSMDFEEMAELRLEQAAKLPDVSGPEAPESIIPLSGFENSREAYPKAILGDEHSSQTPIGLVQIVAPRTTNSTSEAEQHACNYHPLETLCDDNGGLRTLTFKFEVLAYLFDNSHFLRALSTLLLENRDDYSGISKAISSHLSNGVLEHSSAVLVVDYDPLSNFDGGRQNSDYWRLPIIGWFEKIQRNVEQVFCDDELQNFLLTSLNSSKCFVEADTQPVYESLARGPGSYHSILALQMGLFLILLMFSTTTVKPFVLIVFQPFALIVFVIDLPSHDTSSYLGKNIVCLNYNLCFAAEMSFFGLITSFVLVGLVPIMQTLRHDWNSQIHQLRTLWIAIVHAFTATLCQGLHTGGLMVVLDISIGTIDLASLMISNGHSELLVTSCHLTGGKYLDHAWLYFLTSKDQGVQVILIAKISHAQLITLLFNLASKRRVNAFVIELYIQESSTAIKDKKGALADIGANVMVTCAPLLVENVFELATLKHKTEALDNIVLVAFVIVSLVVFQHSHFAKEVRLTDVVEILRVSMIENALSMFSLSGVTSVSSLEDNWVTHLQGLIAMWVKALIGATVLNFSKESYMTLTSVTVVLQEVDIFSYYVQWVVTLFLIHFGCGFFPLLYEWEVMLILHGPHFQASPMFLLEMTPQQFYEATLAKKMILDQTTLLNMESAFFCLAEIESWRVKWFVEQFGTAAHSLTRNWNWFGNKFGVIIILDMTHVECPVSATAIKTLVHNLANFAHSPMLELRIHECSDNFGGLHADNNFTMLPNCLTFYIDAFCFNAAVMIWEGHLTSKKTTQPLCDLALLFVAGHEQFKDWVINLHGLVVIWSHILIGITFFTRKLKFDIGSHITPTGAIATGLVFHFGEDLHTNSRLHMEYSTLRNINIDPHMVYSTLWCLLLFTCAIPNDVVWSGSWLLDYTSTWDLMIMDVEATLYPLTVICKVKRPQSKIDKYMVQNYLGAISTWGCSTYKIETRMMLPMLRVIRKASCFEELVKGVSTTHALCDDHEGAARAISMPHQTAQVLVSLPPREGNHVMMNTDITERRMVPAEIFWAHLRHEDMPSFKGGGLVRTISSDT